MGPGVRQKTDREPDLGGVRAEPERARTRTPDRDAEGRAASARARPPGLNLPPPAAGARHLHARVRRGTGCGSGPAASRGSRAAAAAGTGAGTDLRAAKCDPRWRRTGASRLQRGGESLRPPGGPPPSRRRSGRAPPTPTAPGLPGRRPNPRFPWRRPEVEARREVHATRARGLSGPRRPLRPPSRTGSGAEPPRGRTGQAWFSAGLEPLRTQGAALWRTCAGAGGLFGRFPGRWRSLPAEQMLPAFRCFPC